MIDYEDLGEGLFLIPIDFKDNTSSYSYLYKDEVQISDIVFRKGGMGGTFRDCYCQLISYPDFKLKEGNHQKTSFGIHCIINLDGEIVLSEKSAFNHDIYLKKGVIAKFKDEYYNLKTGKVVAYASSDHVETEEFIWVQHSYESNYRKDSINWPLGVYKINYYTGDVEFFPKKKKETLINI
jgi:hypothetical protein